MQGRRSRWVVGAATAMALAVPSVAMADTNLGTVGGLTYIREDVPATPAPAAMTADANCPSGTHVVGGGITPLGLTNINAQFWVNRTRPFDNADTDRGPDDGWRARGFNRFGEDKAMSVYAICFAGNVRYRSDVAPAAAGSTAAASAACPVGTHVAGGGANLSGLASQAFVNRSIPYDSNDPDSRPDDGWRARAYNQGGAVKRLTVHAECVASLPRYRSQSSSGGLEVIRPSCPAGGHAMGGGGTVQAPSARAFLTAMYPAAPSNPPDDDFVVAVSRTDPSPTYTGTVVCKV